MSYLYYPISLSLNNSKRTPALRCLSRALSIPIHVTAENTHALRALKYLHGTNDAAPHRSTPLHTPSVWRRASADLPANHIVTSTLIATSPFISSTPFGASTGSTVNQQESAGAWRRASGSGGAQLTITPKKQEANPWDDVRDFKGQNTQTHISDTAALPSSTSIPVTSTVITVSYPRLLGAFCLDLSDVSGVGVGSGQTAGHVSPAAAMYRNLLFFLSAVYPSSVLDSQNVKDAEYISAQRPISSPAKFPNWLSVVVVSFNRDNSVSTRAATNANSTKQFLFKLLSALIPHATLLPPPPSLSLPLPLSSSASVSTIAAVVPTHTHTYTSPCPSQSITPTSNPITTSTITSTSTSISTSRLPALSIMVPNHTANTYPLGLSGIIGPGPLSPGNNYFSPHGSSTPHNEFQNPDTSYILSGFELSLGNIVNTIVRACSDTDHQVRVQAVTVLGLLNPEQWRALSSADSTLDVRTDTTTERTPCIIHMIDCLLRACVDSVGTVRVAGFKSFGDATLNGALSLSGLRVGVVGIDAFTCDTTNTGNGVGRMDTGRMGGKTLGVGVGVGVGIQSKVLTIGIVLKHLQLGCKDTKLAVSLRVVLCCIVMCCDAL